MLNIDDFHNVEKKDFNIRTEEYEYVLRGNKYKEGGLNLEFGVYKGISINDCAKIRPNLTFWGFDSFQGLPEFWRMNDQHILTKETHSLAGKPPTVEKNVNLVKGWFSETLPKWWTEHKGDISWLNMDADLYSSTIYVLKTINEGIVPGTIIRFDELCDWRVIEGTGKEIPSAYVKWQEGEWKALNEWVDEYNRKIEPIARNRTNAAIIRVLE